MKFPRGSLYLIGGGTLLACIPVVGTAKENVDSLNWSDFWSVLLIVAGVTSVLLTALSLLTRHSVAIVASLALVNWLSAYAPEISGVLRNLTAPVGAQVTFTTAVPLIFLSLLILLSLLPRKLIISAVGVNGLALVAIAAVPLASGQFTKERTVQVAEVREKTIHQPLPEPAEISRELPDIIYIVPDRYGSADVLADIFHYDNMPFLDSLRARGFAIAPEARANYLRTKHSLASTFNMQYLNAFLSYMDGKTNSPKPLYSLIENNLVVRRLKRMGYRYIHVGSWWDGTRQSAQSDMNVNFWPFVKIGGELGRAILPRSMVFVASMALIGGELEWSACEALKDQLRFLESVGGDDRPTFTFAHVLAPHSPILTDAEGRCIDPVDYPLDARGVTWGYFKESYTNYLSYINKRMLEIFDAQRGNNKNPIIFVIQADEGPWPKAFRRASAQKTPFDWNRVSNRELIMKYGIMNALYLENYSGDVENTNVSPDLSPVNNWRIIFSYLDNKPYSLLRNRHFIAGTSKGHYHSFEITGRLQAVAQYHMKPAHGQLSRPMGRNK